MWELCSQRWWGGEPGGRVIVPVTSINHTINGRALTGRPREPPQLPRGRGPVGAGEEHAR